jgi:hypothetical protein
MRATALSCVLGLMSGGCASEQTLDADALRALLGDAGLFAVGGAAGGTAFPSSGGFDTSGAGGFDSAGGQESNGGGLSGGGDTSMVSSGGVGVGGRPASSGGGTTSGGGGGTSGGTGGSSGGSGATGGTGAACKASACPGCLIVLGTQCCKSNNTCGCQGFGFLPCG